MTSSFPDDPYELFHFWYEQVEGETLLKKNLRSGARRLLQWLVPETRRIERNAMVLSTVGEDLQPSARIVLLKDVRAGRFVFYTNYSSQKAQELEFSPKAALTFYWPLPPHQVRIEGVVSRVSRQDSENYWNSRPRGSQLGALASRQSETLDSEESLQKKLKELERKWKGHKIPCPENWGGYALKPHRFEFWVGRPNRLHQRIEYRISSEGEWEQRLLYP